MKQILSFMDYLDNKNWVDFAKNLKEHFVKTTDRGDIVPTIIAEKNDEVFCVAVAPEIDKSLAFKASSILRVGAGADAITLLLDAHMAIAKPGEDKDEFLKKYPRGAMQKACDEEGACEKGEIVDCLICHHIEESGKISIKAIPYSYHGKGTEFKWLDQEEKYKEFCKGKEEEDLKFEGDIPDTLRSIMLERCFTDSPQLKKLSEEMNYSEERQLFHIQRTIFNVLHHEKYAIVDAISIKHPEWINADKKAEEVVLKLAEINVIPQMCVIPLLKIIEDNLATEAFGIKIVEFLGKYKDKLGPEFHKVIEEESLEKAGITLALMIHERIFTFVQEIPKGALKKIKLPMRVKVWSGDQSEFLGEGNYVDNVTVYVTKDENSIQSARNAEEKPEFGDYHEIPRNPKIILDSGETVYGCQVWFEPIIEEKSKWPTEQKKSMKWGSHVNAAKQSAEFED